jgi:hypothetical protein
MERTMDLHEWVAMCADGENVPQAAHMDRDAVWRRRRGHSQSMRYCSAGEPVSGNSGRDNAIDVGRSSSQSSLRVSRHCTGVTSRYDSAAHLLVVRFARRLQVRERPNVPSSFSERSALKC